MTKVKNIIFFLVVIVVFVMIGLNYKKIGNKLSAYIYDIRNQRKEIIIKDSNVYSKHRSYKFVETTENFRPNNYNDLINIFYTILDNGWTEFTFYCGEGYAACVNDVDTLSNDQVLLSNINNYVNPFNSYSQIRVVYDEYGEVDVFVTHTYNNEEREKIQNRISGILNQLVNDKMSDKEKIKTIHDYIINNTKYDVERKEKGSSSYDSTKATGVLFQGYGICSGYADTMALFLDSLGIDNFKVSSANHVWNAVWIDNSWYHLDLTWDDPVSSDGRDILQYDFFLVDSATLLKKDITTSEHNYNNNYYFIN